MKAHEETKSHKQACQSITILGQPIAVAGCLSVFEAQASTSMTIFLEL